MNRYHLKIYFSNTVNYETYVDSKLDMNNFIEDMDKKFNNVNHKFIIFAGDDVKYSINTNNVLFYTIKLVQQNITEKGD